MRLSQKENNLYWLLVIFIMDNIIKSAALQKLCDFLGYDEGKFYFSLLNKKKSGEYSHSKSYRLFKSLYNSGASAKVRDVKKEKDFLNYLIMPPTFLCSADVEKEILDYLEKIYMKNYGEIFNRAYLEMSIEQGNQIFLFFLKNYMKDYGIVIHGSDKYYPIYKKYLSSESFEKVFYICRKDQISGVIGKIISVEPHFIANKRAIIIDGKIVAEFFRFPKEANSEMIKPRYFGYYLSKDILIDSDKGRKSYIKQVEEELKKLFNLP